MTRKQKQNAWIDLYDMKELHFAFIAGLTFVTITQLFEFAVDFRRTRLVLAFVAFIFLALELNKYRELREQSDFLEIAALKHKKNRKNK